MTPFVARASAPGRNLDLQHLADLLHERSARALDVIAGTGAIHAEGGRLVLDGTEPVLGPDGVTMTAGAYTVNDVAMAGISDKLNIPLAYLRRMHADAVELWDSNVEGWLARMNRRLLIRVLRDDNGSGVARAVLSDRYAKIDDLDVLLAALDGIRASGAPVQIEGADIGAKRMYLKVSAPSVRALAPGLLANYRSPFTGQAGRDLPVVWAGFVITNSEVGCGAFEIRPRIVTLICKNGAVLTTHGIRRTHLGARHDDADGEIAWSRATTAKTLELITAKTTDAVAAFLDPDYLQRMVRELEAAAGRPVTDPDTTIKTIATKLRYSDEQAKDILAHFITGADLSAGGILHAVTSVAQTLPDADAAHDLESTAIQAMHLAAATA
jgi:hypothetical protein